MSMNIKYQKFGFMRLKVYKMSQRQKKLKLQKT